MRLPWRKYVYVQEHPIDDHWSRRRVLYDDGAELIVEYYDFRSRAVMYLSQDGTVEGDPARHWREAP